MEVVALCVTVLLGVAGFVFNDRSARKAKRRDIRTQFLLSAYGCIEACSNRPLDETTARDLERAVADVQLLGTRSQVTAAQTFAKAFAEAGEADTTDLLETLRADLRADLDLEPIEQRRTHLRITVDSDEPVKTDDAALVSVNDRDLERSVLQMSGEAVNDLITAGSQVDPEVAAADELRRQAEFSQLDEVRSVALAPTLRQVGDNFAATFVERIRADADSDPRSAMHEAIKAFEITMTELAHYRAERKGLRLVEDEEMSIRELVNHPSLVSEAFQRQLISVAEWESWTAVRTTKAMLQRGHTPAPGDVLNVLQLAELAMLKAQVGLLERKTLKSQTVTRSPSSSDTSPPTATSP